jgi:hypothetical protein
MELGLNAFPILTLQSGMTLKDMLTAFNEERKAASKRLFDFSVFVPVRSCRFRP